MDMSILQNERLHGYRCECSGHVAPGWRLESYWAEDEAVCTWYPRTVPGIGSSEAIEDRAVADLIVCHCLGTAVAAAHLADGPQGGPARRIRYATASLQMTYLSPAAANTPLTLRARVRELDDGTTTLTCSLFTDLEEHARGEVVAVRVPAP
ncbi:MAG TPA: hypothetical protein VJT32_13115 [bacterium]|nr:hypothetical protein [bacterium]